MSKLKTVYICQSCSYKSPQWVGQCPECLEWNSLVETVVESRDVPKDGISAARKLKTATLVKKLSSIDIKQAKRISSNINEFDRVLGGGFVPGQVVLISGAPGIGKSTLLTQLCAFMKNSQVLYVCGEESAVQVRFRTNRMDYPAENIFVLEETSTGTVIAGIEYQHAKGKLGLIIIDSIQSLRSDDLTGLAGSVGQIRHSAEMLIRQAKRLGVPMLIVGHITKEGSIAGPKVLEHVVDTVLYLEGDSNHVYRILKTTKNRFGPVSEVGVFEMTGKGMIEVKNPSELFLGLGEQQTSGTCTTVVMEGYRAMLFEVQALTTRSVYGYPKRTTSGFNMNRLQVLIAILEKRAKLKLSDYDIYVSISGGYKVNEYSVDLAVCLAVASSLRDKPLKKSTIAFGECGLSGEIRNVPYMENRVKEAKKLGYKNIISPKFFNNINTAIEKAF